MATRGRAPSRRGRRAHENRPAPRPVGAPCPVRRCFDGEGEVKTSPQRRKGAEHRRGRRGPGFRGSGVRAAMQLELPGFAPGTALPHRTGAGPPQARAARGGAALRTGLRSAHPVTGERSDLANSSPRGGDGGVSRSTAPRRRSRSVVQDRPWAAGRGGPFFRTASPRCSGSGCGRRSGGGSCRAGGRPWPAPSRPVPGRR